MTFEPNDASYGQTEQPDIADPATQWPPAPTVWPPLPAGAYLPPTFYPFKFSYEKTIGSIADFREGSFGVDQNGLTIQGRVQPRAEIYQTVLVITFLLGRWLALIAYCIMRYGCLSPATSYIPWNMVQSITTVPKKRKVCVAYTGSNYAGKVMTFSLAMRFTPEEFASLSSQLDGYCPGLAQPGKLKSGTTILVWVVLVLLLGVIAIGAMKFLQPSHP